MPQQDDPVLVYIEALYVAAGELASGEDAGSLADASERLRALDPRHPMLPALQAKLDGLVAPMRDAPFPSLGTPLGADRVH